MSWTLSLKFKFSSRNWHPLSSSLHLLPGNLLFTQACHYHQITNIFLLLLLFPTLQSLTLSFSSQFTGLIYISFLTLKSCFSLLTATNLIFTQPLSCLHLSFHFCSPIQPAKMFKVALNAFFTGKFFLLLSRYVIAKILNTPFLDDLIHCCNLNYFHLWVENTQIIHYPNLFVTFLM